MTKQEFIQEATLRLISARPDYLMQEIAELAVKLAGYIYPEEKVQEQKQQDNGGHFSKYSDNIKTLIDELARIDSEYVQQQYEDAKKRGMNWKFQKSGFAMKVSHACDMNNIKTVYDLMEFGRKNFISQRYIGDKCTNAVDKALKNLYNIRKW